MNRFQSLIGGSMAQPKMKIHVSYSQEDQAVTLALYDGEEAIMILLDEEQAQLLIKQTEDALTEHDKNNLLN